MTRPPARSVRRTAARRWRPVLTATAAAVLLAACDSGTGDALQDRTTASTAVMSPSSVSETAPRSTSSSVSASVSSSLDGRSTGASAPTATASPPPSPEPTPTAAPTPEPDPDGPGPITADDLRAATELVAGMTDEERAGAVIMANSAHAVGTDLVARLHLGGVILMGSRGVVDGTTGGTPAQVRAVTDAVQAQVLAGRPPALIATDQEYGTVARLVNGFTAFPGADELGAVDDLATAAELTRQTAAAAAAELRAVGITVDFAPVADVLPVSGASSIGDRSYGTDPDRVAALTAAAVIGYQSGGVAATVKHFPGIGSLAADTHQTLPTLGQDCAQWNEHERPPFRAAVDAGVAMVMTGHVRLPAVDGALGPTSLSPRVVTQLLRGTGDVAGCQGLGYGGIAVSDALEMDPVADRYDSAAAAVQALSAGQDLLLMPVDPEAAHQGVVTAVRDGSLDPARLAEAATRVTALRIAGARTPQPGLEVVGSAEHQALVDRVDAAA
ncbi:glycoside hydrolase family 3 protein [Nakamurella leprariae]|uniref:beta-N-acetylhexosaminidase n=1 Tax=Nakamurella leprariae TaxID=2803911 RepID=A0A939C082_9ACTN|nr:glycoside hydrolase family 3 N-terminal domain-containing protein [Nakamurella leprariae]MBM9465729.1 hypothetical protein [Nakamurella leprariae]